MPTTASTRIPWTRILAEGAVIVVSILLAFAIDAAWDATRDRAAQRATLTDLRGELTESLRLATEALIVEVDRVLEGR